MAGPEKGRESWKDLKIFTTELQRILIHKNDKGTWSQVVAQILRINRLKESRLYWLSFTMRQGLKLYKFFQ